QDTYRRYTAFKSLIESGVYDMLQFKNLCIVVKQPQHVRFDDQKRIHCENDSCIAWDDGYKLYAINGVVVPEKVVLNPETITIQEIQSEENQEKRRIMIERYGADKYLGEIDAQVIDVDIRGVHGAGPRALMREPNGNQWLVCNDGSTDRVYHLFVPDSIKTCR
ncbi:MAG: hypothetical protein CUN55_18290, partial [Phototrophicales bacterium]